MGERIVTKCPSCGGRSLFVGVGGHLTCSYLECPEPVVETAIASLTAENATLKEDEGLERMAIQNATSKRIYELEQENASLTKKVGLLKAELIRERRAHIQHLFDGDLIEAEDYDKAMADIDALLENEDKQ